MDTQTIIRKSGMNKPNEANLKSFTSVLDKYEKRFGLEQAHRYAQLIPQLQHESLDFKYDKEIWGPTPAQKRYDTRTDLGNTPEADGDGKLYAGRGPIQITGKANYARFTAWCRKFIDPKAPDFVAKPELVNTDPWEGLVVLWYWDAGNPTGKSLNRFADIGDVEMITRKINGGLNGFDDRVARLVRVSLVILGYGPSDLIAFQQKAGVVADGIPGPKTRSALHEALLRTTEGAVERKETSLAPVTEIVVEEKPVAVTPEQIDKPVTQTTGFWERVTGIVTAAGGMGAAFTGDWRIAASAFGAIILLAGMGLVFHNQIINAVQKIKKAVEQ